MIEASQSIINYENNNLLSNQHEEFGIKMLQNAPRDADKLKRLLEIKQRQKQEADHIEDT
jgi:hypothetical protein